MRPFRSKLAALLTIRQKQEQAKLESYARAMQARQAALEARRTVEQRVTVLQGEVRASMQAGCTASALSQFQGYGLRLADELRRADGQLAAAENTLTLALDELQAARRKRETVEKFQAKERAGYSREVLAEEQKLLDEMALRRVASNLACGLAGA